jgi:hypothetical protein
MGAWGKDGVMSASPHLSHVENIQESSSDLWPRFLRIDSPLSSRR